MGEDLVEDVAQLVDLRGEERHSGQRKGGGGAHVADSGGRVGARGTPVPHLGTRICGEALRRGETGTARREREGERAREGEGEGEEDRDRQRQRQRDRNREQSGGERETEREREKRGRERERERESESERKRRREGREGGREWREWRRGPYTDVPHRVYLPRIAAGAPLPSRSVGGKGAGPGGDPPGPAPFAPSLASMTFRRLRSFSLPKKAEGALRP